MNNRYLTKDILMRLLCVFSLTVINTSRLYAEKDSYGLQTKFAEVTLAGLKPGMVYSVKKEHDLPYRVINSASKTRQVEVIVTIPQDQHLREGYEPIPDESWIQVVPNTFELQPGESTSCDLIVSVPEDEKYVNRHYQAMIRTQTVEDPDSSGVSVSFAIQTRFKFSTGPSPAVERAEYRKKVLEALKIEMMPFSLDAGEFELGGKVTLDGFDRPAPQLINRGKESFEVELSLAGNPKNYGLAQGYEEVPDEFKVNLDVDKINLKSRRIEDIPITVELPDDEKYLDKKYAIVVVAIINWNDLPIKLYSRVYFKTSEK